MRPNRRAFPDASLIALRFSSLQLSITFLSESGRHHCPSDAHSKPVIMFYSHERKSPSLAPNVSKLTPTSPNEPSVRRRDHLVLHQIVQFPNNADRRRLVATLGSKSNLKKVTRKAILDVDVPKACNTITDPSTPLALRLQASLLFVTCMSADCERY